MIPGVKFRIGQNGGCERRIDDVDVLLMLFEGGSAEFSSSGHKINLFSLNSMFNMNLKFFYKEFDYLLSLEDESIFQHYNDIKKFVCLLHRKHIHEVIVFERIVCNYKVDCKSLECGTRLYH